jgi:CheY-like chemotaxis protein
MPRRKEVTVDCLNFQWNPDGSVASSRQSTRIRPMAAELGRVLLALARESGAAAGGSAGPDTLPPSTAEVGRLVHLSERETRAALRDLLPTGTIAQQRVRLGRQRDFARWAHGFELAPVREMRGPGRRPRLCQIALLLEPNEACGDLLDVLLRGVGMLAVQVTTVQDALCLLNRIGFDLVVLDASAATTPPGLSTLMHAIHAAACGPIILTRGPGAPGDVASYAHAVRALLAKPFTPREFDATLSKLRVGTAALRPDSEGIGA